MNDALYAKARRIVSLEMSRDGDPDDVLQSLADAGLHLIEDQPLDVDGLTDQLAIAWAGVESSLAALGRAREALVVVSGLLAPVPFPGAPQTGSEPAPNAGEPGAVPSRAPAPGYYVLECAWGCSYSAQTSTPGDTNILMERHYRLDHGDYPR